MTREANGDGGRSGRPDDASLQGHEDVEVHSITTAAPGHSVDMHQRMVRYAVAMGIRMVCIIALFFLDGWFKLIAVAGAVFLPWVAVVIANAQTQAEQYEGDLIDYAPLGELEAGPAAAEDGREEPVTLQGETVDDEAPSPPTPDAEDGRPEG